MSMPSGFATRGRWYHGWTVVFATVVSQIAGCGLGLNSMSLFLHDLAGDLHCPVSNILLAISMFGTATAIFSPIMGVIADRYPARWLFALGLIGVSIFEIAMSAVTAIWQIWVLFGTLFPISLTMCTVLASNALVSRWFVRRTGLALGLSGIGIGISGVILPPLIAVAMPVVGWREVWRAAGILTALVVLPFVVWIVRERSAERDGLRYMDGTATSPHHGQGGRGDGSVRWRDILTSRTFWLLVFCFISIVSLSFGIQQNFAPIVISRGMTVKTAGFLLGLFSLMHVIATPILGFASDRFGSRLPFVIVGTAAMIGGVLVGYGNSLLVLVAGAAFVGFSGSLWALAAATILGEFGAGGVGRAFGALMLGLPISSLVAASIAKAQESTGSYGPPLLALSLLCLFSGTCTLFMRERRAGHRTTAGNAAVLKETANLRP